MATVLPGSAAAGTRLVVRPGGAQGSLGNEGLDAAVTDDARGLLAQGATGLQWYGERGERRMQDVSVFVQTYAPPPRMLVFGAIDHAAATARIGSFLGYRVTVCDARPAFATRERFPTADEVVCAWPHTYLSDTEIDGRTVVCVLTHDPKFDVPLLVAALRTPAAYIGVMGAGVPTWTGSPGCARRGWPNRTWSGSPHPWASTSAPVRRRRRRSRSPRRSSSTAGAARGGRSAN